MRDRDRKIETKQVLLRLRDDVNAGMDALKARNRMSKSVIAENAIREYLAKHDINLTEPKAD